MSEVQELVGHLNRVAAFGAINPVVRRKVKEIISVIEALQAEVDRLNDEGNYYSMMFAEATARAERAEGALREVREACLYAEDDGIGVTLEPSLSDELFKTICDILRPPSLGCEPPLHGAGSATGTDAATEARSLPQTYRFGDPIEMIAASQDNPHKFGLFVRAYTRTGRLNPGKTIVMTDGRGAFWETPPDNVRSAPPNAGGN